MALNEEDFCIIFFFQLYAQHVYCSVNLVSYFHGRIKSKVKNMYINRSGMGWFPLKPLASDISHIISL